MARPIKDGVEYFPKDTDFYSDDKVRLLRAEFGAKGMYILDYILCTLYNKNGYFLKWDKSTCFLVSDGAGCGCDPEFISEFIAGCIRCSFFDERVFDVFGVLTSAGIQRRYIRMFNSRDEILINKEYWLLDVGIKKDVPTGILQKITFITDKSTENPDKSTENPDKTTENPDKTTENPQNKTEQNKSNKKREKENTGAATGDDFIPSPIAKVFDEFVQARKVLKKPLTDYAKRLAISKLDRLAPGDYEMQKRIINQSIERGWSGLFELKDERGDIRNGTSEFKPSRV